MKITEIKALLPSRHRPLQVLQVFNGGRPCGWLGCSDQGYWFHYGSNTSSQAWVGLLMPPSANFYQASTLFPAFAQHLPEQKLQEQVQQLYADVQLGMLDYLYLFNMTHLGPVSYANPDNPVVLQNPYVDLTAITQESFEHSAIQALPLSAGQAVDATCHLVRITPRASLSDTLLFPSIEKSTINALLEAKKKADPQNRLTGLRWLPNTTVSSQFCWFPRPDLIPYDQRLLGIEKISSILNMTDQEYAHLLECEGLYVSVIEEAIRTFCRHSAAEISLFRQLVPLLSSKGIQVFVVYQQAKPSAALQRPSIVGLEFLPL